MKLAGFFDITNKMTGALCDGCIQMAAPGAKTENGVDMPDKSRLFRRGVCTMPGANPCQAGTGSL